MSKYPLTAPGHGRHLVSAAYRSSCGSGPISHLGPNAAVIGTRQWRSSVDSVIMGAEGALFSLLSREQELSLLLPASSSVESNATGEGEGDVEGLVSVLCMYAHVCVCGK